MRRLFLNRKCKLRPIKLEHYQNAAEITENTDTTETTASEEEEEEDHVKGPDTLQTLLYAIYSGMAGLDIIKADINNNKLIDYITTVKTLHAHNQLLCAATEKFYSTSTNEEDSYILREAHLQLLHKRAHIYTLLSKKINENKCQS